jgi:hypothetical protein
LCAARARASASALTFFFGERELSAAHFSALSEER